MVSEFHKIIKYLYNIKQYFLSVCLSVRGMFPPSGRNFEATVVWFLVNDSKFQGAGVSVIYIPTLRKVNP